MKSETKENIKGWLGCLFWILAALLLYKGCNWYSTSQKEKAHRAFLEKQRNDSIRKAYIADSLAHDPHYQESLRRIAEERRIRKEVKKEIAQIEIAGFVYGDESIYHTTFHPVGYYKNHHIGFTTDDISDICFVTRTEIKRNNLKRCYECMNLDVELLLDNGDVIRPEDAEEYDLIPKEEADKYCNHLFF